MITFQEHTGFKQVENYGFAEWLKEVQEVIQDGYEFDFDSNDGYPLQIGTVYTAVMKPRVDVAIQTEVSWGDPDDLKKALDLLQKAQGPNEALLVTVEATDTPEVPLVHSKVDGRKKK